MAQGLDVRSLGSAKSPTIDSKPVECVKRTRGMGSRRIFSPLFKLQVLDSYRNDVDCKGNQRATARKYNIHRRQIQKWLQCEQSLRTSVEDSGKSKVADPTGAKSRKKTSEGDDRTDVTLNQSATAFGKLEEIDVVKDEEDAVAVSNTVPRPIAHKPDNGIYGTTFQVPDNSKIDAQNLKRVAQKLYPSLQNIPCVLVPGQKVTQPDAHVERQIFSRDEGVCALSLSSNSADKRDGNFNRVLQTETVDAEVPLDLKSKVLRSESLPEEFLASSTTVEELSEGRPNKLRIGSQDNCQSDLISSSEKNGGPKLSASNAMVKRLVQKYNMGDIDGQELCPGDFKLLCSQSVNNTESSCLLRVPVPKNSASSSLSPGSGAKRKLNWVEEPGEDSESNKNFCGVDKKAKVESFVHAKGISRFEYTKSFSPKRKWIKESMQDMLGDAEQPQEPTSLPIKQRVKMNLRSLPEATKKCQDSGKSNSLSNFSIEKLCTPDSAREPENLNPCTHRSSCSLHPTTEPSFPYPTHPSPFIISNHNVVSLRFKSDMYNPEVHESVLDTYNSSDYSTNLSVKEEKVSDSEDADVDVLSTTPVEKKSFDFSGYNFGKRRSFSVQFKLTVLDAFYNDKDCNKNQRATARKFNINRRQVQKWLSQENDLRNESSLKNGKYLQRQRLATEARETEGCAKCPQHCLRKKDEMYRFDQTIEVNVKPCTDQQCLSRRNNFDSIQEPRARLTEEVEFYSKTVFPSDIKATNFYHNYLYPDNNNLIFHDSFWSNLNSSALAVPNFQCLTTWHHPHFCQENSKIY